MAIFDTGPATDRDFVRLQSAKDRYSLARSYLEDLYVRVAPYLDSDFPQKIRNHFHASYWEMHLAAALLDAGIKLIERKDRKGKDAGPDLLGIIGDKRHWFEAVAVMPGTGPDRVEYPEDPQPTSRNVQDEQIMLRLRSGIAEKLAKFEGYLRTGLIRSDEGYTIALNAYALGIDAILEVTVPRIVKCVLPIGHEVAHINLQTRKITNYTHKHRGKILKGSGASVETNLFQDPRFSGISAVLFSCASIWGDFWPAPFPVEKPAPKPGCSFIIVHNPLTSVPLPHGTIKAGVEYWVEEDVLQRKSWNQQDA